MTDLRQHCDSCNKIGTKNCPYDVELYNRDGGDYLVPFKRDIKILTLNDVSELCGLQCHSSATVICSEHPACTGSCSGEVDGKLHCTAAEQDSDIRKATIYELLKHFKFACPGEPVNPICDLCGANQYCIELRKGRNKP